jgi:uncharacterized protein YjbI with pentapeptide repeats
MPDYVATDVQAALTVISRRKPVDKERRINLSSAVVPGANFGEGNLQGAVLAEARLERAFLFGAHLDGAFFIEADLQGATLINAHLQGATFIGADLQGANLRGAHLQGAIFDGAGLEGAELRGAHLEGADLAFVHGLLQSQLDDATVDEDTKLPEGLHPPGAAPQPAG